MGDAPLLPRATLAGLVLLAFSAAAALAALGLAQTFQAGEANDIAWLSWWTSVLGGLLALLGLFVPGLRRL